MTPTIIGLDYLKKLAGEALVKQVQAQKDSYVFEAFTMSQGHSKQQSTARAKVNSFDVTLTYRGDQLEGACSCPVSDGFDFCEHCVALTLHANRISQQMMSLSKGPDKSKVMAYLLSLDKAELAKHTMALLEQDSGNFKRYLLKASLDQETLDLAALKSEMTALTRPQKGLFSQRQLKHFFGRIERFLEELQVVDQIEQASGILKLVEYSVVRLNKLLLRMEDRNNLRQAAVDRLRDLFARYFKSLEGRPEALAKRFAKLWLVDRFEVLGLSPVPYFDHQPLAYQAFLKHRLEQWQTYESASSSTSSFKSLSTSGSSIGSGQLWSLERLARLLLSEPETEIELAERNELENAAQLRVIFEQFREKLSEATMLTMQKLLAKTPEDQASLAQSWLRMGHIEEANALMCSVVEAIAGGGVITKDGDRSEYSSEAILLIERAFVHFAEQDGQIDYLFSLFQRAPVELAQALQDYARKHHANILALRCAMAESLNSHHDLDSQYLLARLYLLNGDAASINDLLAVQRFKPEQVAHLAIGLAKLAPESALPVMVQVIPKLLEKDMASADKLAAELVSLLEQFDKTHFEVQDFLKQIGPRLRANPRFMRSYQSQPK